MASTLEAANDFGFATFWPTDTKIPFMVITPVDPNAGNQLVVVALEGAVPKSTITYLGNEGQSLAGGAFYSVHGVFEGLDPDTSYNVTISQSGVFGGATYSDMATRTEPDYPSLVVGSCDKSVYSTVGIGEGDYCWAEIKRRYDAGEKLMLAWTDDFGYVDGCTDLTCDDSTGTTLQPTNTGSKTFDEEFSDVVANWDIAWLAYFGMMTKAVIDPSTTDGDKKIAQGRWSARREMLRKIPLLVIPGDHECFNNIGTAATVEYDSVGTGSWSPTPAEVYDAAMASFDKFFGPQYTDIWNGTNLGRDHRTPGQTPRSIHRKIGSSKSISVGGMDVTRRRIETSYFEETDAKDLLDAFWDSGADYKMLLWGCGDRDISISVQGGADFINQPFKDNDESQYNSFYNTWTHSWANQSGVKLACHGDVHYPFVTGPPTHDAWCIGPWANPSLKNVTSYNFSIGDTVNGAEMIWFPNPNLLPLTFLQNGESGFFGSFKIDADKMSASLVRDSGHIMFAKTY